MNLGDKIRKYRTLKGLTQKDLGIEVGFSAATADSRIRKYEKNIMAPKEDIRSKIADALDVDLSAISDIDVQNYEDIMQILFLFEEEFGMEIERSEEKTSLIFDNNNKEISTLISYFYAWYHQIKNLPPMGDEKRDAALIEYRKWKARFPKDISDYWIEQQNDIEVFYQPLVSKLSKSRKAICKLSEFVHQIRKMIQAGISIETGTKLYGVGDSSLTMSFFVSELLNPKTPEINNSFAEFLCDISTLKNYGMPLCTDLITDDRGTQIVYNLRFSPLTTLGNIIFKIQNYESNKNNLNDYDIKMFEQSYANDLKYCELDLEKEIARHNRIHK